MKFASMYCICGFAALLPCMLLWRLELVNHDHSIFDLLRFAFAPLLRCWVYRCLELMTNLVVWFDFFGFGCAPLLRCWVFRRLDLMSNVQIHFGLLRFCFAPLLRCSVFRRLERAYVLILASLYYVLASHDSFDVGRLYILSFDLFRFRLRRVASMFGI